MLVYVTYYNDYYRCASVSARLGLPTVRKCAMSKFGHFFSHFSGPFRHPTSSHRHQTCCRCRGVCISMKEQVSRTWTASHRPVSCEVSQHLGAGSYRQLQSTPISLAPSQTTHFIPLSLLLMEETSRFHGAKTFRGRTALTPQGLQSPSDLQYNKISKSPPRPSGSM